MDIQIPNGSSFIVTAANTKIRELNRPVLSPIATDNVSIISLKKDNRLPYITAAMCNNILENTISSLRILEQCNNANSVKLALHNMDKFLLKKYKVKAPPPSEEVIQYPLDCDENKLKKMSADRKICLDILGRVYAELGLSRTHMELTEFINQRDKSNQALIAEVDERKLQYREVKQKLRSQRNTQTFQRLYYIETIDRLQDLVADTEHMSAIKGRYTVNWRKAQTEELAQKIHNDQEKIMNSIQFHKSEFDRECRAHDEIERYYSIVTAEKLTKVEEIMDLYRDDIEAINLKILIIMSKLAETTQKRIDMENKLAKRQKEIEAWTKYKNIRAGAEATSKRMYEAAIIVQAWWRGLLVRQRLGPFKPATGKGGKKPKGRKGSKTGQGSNANDEIQV